MGRYRVKQDFVQDGRALIPGDCVELTARQARYLRLSGLIEPAPDEASGAPEAVREDQLDSREDLIRGAIERLTPGEAGHWTAGGQPEVRALREHGAPADLSARERDAVWAGLQEAGGER